MILLKIIGLIFLIVIVFAMILVSMSIIHHLWVLHNIRCKYCNHKMHCKGMTKHNDENRYMFHCPECGSWEYLSVRDVLGGNKNSEA